jgi:hypothetical protein
VVEAGQRGREGCRVAGDDPDVRRAQPARVLDQLARPAGVDLDRRHLAREHRGLAARGGTAVARPLAFACPDGQRRQLRGAALRPDPARREHLLVDALDPHSARKVGRLALDLSADDADDGLGRLVLRPHERQRLLVPQLLAPELVDRVGVRVLERSLRRPVEELPQPLLEPP